jgi:hypothetical protein
MIFNSGIGGDRAENMFNRLDGYHGGIYGHYPLWNTQFMVDRLAQHVATDKTQKRGAVAPFPLTHTETRFIH